MTKTWQFLPMQNIVFVVYPGFEMLDLAGPTSVFNGANRALSLRSRPAFYEITVISAAGGTIESSSGIVVDTSAIATLSPCRTATVIIVGAEREPLLAAIADAALREAVPSLAASAERFGSVCTGGFVLASLGLLDGHEVATHWDSSEPLAKTFPHVKVNPDALYVVDGRIWSSAGVTTGIDMALAMVAQDLDATVASEVAKRLVLYARRPGYQSQFSPLLRAQVRADSPFGELISWVQSNLDQPLEVPLLAARVGMTERTFHRKFAAATGETPARFVETARLDAARMLLSRGLSLKAVAAEVGLFPPARLAEAFERRFGIAPRLFRDMHAQL